MARKNFSQQIEEKLKLGETIKMLRIEKEISLRSLAEHTGLSPSNITYIEKGVNVPTGEVYLKILSKLKPSDSARAEMDKLYMQIRKLPPPDVCDILLKNPELIKKIRNKKF